MSASPTRPPEPSHSSSTHKGDITALIREEAARRRTSEGSSHEEGRASRIPYRLLAIMVLATVTVVATTKSVFQVMVFLKHPGDNAVGGVKLDEVDPLVPAASIALNGKTLVVSVGSSWESLGHHERARRLSELAGLLANRYYHGATLLAPSGREIGTWTKGRIHVE